MDFSLLSFVMAGFVFTVTVNYATALGNESEVDTFGYGESLTIASPNYPANYPNDADTNWLVSGPADYQIMAVFSTFQLEYDDILRMGSGLDQNDTSSLLATLSGSSLPDVVVSTNNQMWLVFTSDSSYTKQGFRIDIRVFTPLNFSGNVTGPSSSSDFMNSSRIYSGETIIRPSAEILYADKCFEESCFGVWETTVCRCDDMCQFFGDCCPDYPLPILNETLANETTVDLDVWECIVDSYLPPFYPDLRHGYRMIARCPSDWSLDEDIKRSCEDVSANATANVLYVHEGTYFRNLGCATCHGYEESSMTAIVIFADRQCWWGYDHTLKCMTQMPTSQDPSFYSSTSESDIYMPDNIQNVPKPRLCLVDTTESCPNGTKDEIARKQCQYHYKPYISEGIVSKHPGCSHCNGGSVVRCPPKIIPLSDDVSRIGILDIFRLEPQLVNVKVTPIPTTQCREGFQMDENDNCVPISSDWAVCQLTRFEVEQINAAEECLQDMVCFRQVTIDNVTLHLTTPLPCLAGPLKDEVNNTITFSLIYRDDMNPSLDTIQRDIIDRVQALSHYKCENMVISARKSCYVVDDNPGNITNLCSEEEFVGHYSYFTPSLINNETLIFFNGTYVQPRWWSNVTSIEFSHDNVSSEYQFILCGTEIALQTCSFFIVSNDSVEWIDQENLSVILHQGQVYDIENVLENPDGSISICYMDQGTPNGTHGGRALIILGHVLVAVSSVFLFATLITYVTFSTLRNRQGVSIMNFIIALFLGQILLQYIRLSVSHLSIPCVIVAALSHFFFLASFVWTTILAWDLSRSFAASKMKSFSSSSFGRKMVAFLVIGWGTPLVFVLITLVLQFGGFKNDPILEYDSTTCWLAKLSSIVMFYVPMSACLLSNIVLFIITVHGVHSTKKTTLILKRGQESQFKQWAVELRIYVKISALLGFAWLFGFLAMVTSVPFMEYLFIIVIGLQGVFIFMSFGANERVKKLWRTSVESSTVRTTLTLREHSRSRSNIPGRTMDTTLRNI